MSFIETGRTDPYGLLHGYAPDAEHPTAIFLIGPPGAGKTTWRIGYHATHGDAATTVLSTDDLIEDWAAERGLTYTAAFGMVDFTAMETEMFARMTQAVQQQRHLVIDRTNMTARSRGRFLGRLPAGYRRHALVFTTPLDEVLRRLAERARTGKSIPPAVVTDMLARYEAPSDTDFHLIKTIGGL